MGDGAPQSYARTKPDTGEKIASWQALVDAALTPVLERLERIERRLDDADASRERRRIEAEALRRRLGLPLEASEAEVDAAIARAKGEAPAQGAGLLDDPKMRGRLYALIGVALSALSAWMTQQCSTPAPADQAPPPPLPAIVDEGAP